MPRVAPLAKPAAEAYVSAMAGPLYMDAVIRQNASLSRAGFMVLLTGVVAFNVIFAVFLFVIGAWPVPIFLGLDVLAIWLAFRASFRAAERKEHVRVSAETVEVSLEADGREKRVWSSPTAFTGLDVEAFGQDDTKVRLRMHRKRYLVGRALSPGERADLGRALGDAIHAARAERYPAR